MELETPVALVIGANKGIGKAIARGLVMRGILVNLGARDVERGRQAAEELGAAGTVSFLSLDVLDEGSIAVAVQEIATRYGRLDILVNNAGISGQIKLPSEYTSADIRTVYATNVFAVVDVINAFLPLLQRSSAGRIVNVMGLSRRRRSVGWETSHGLFKLKDSFERVDRALCA